PLEGVDLVKREVSLAKRFHALHDIEQPAPRLRRFISKKKRPLPFCENELLLPNDATLNDVNLAGFRNAAEQDVRSDPAGAARSECQRLSLLNNLADKEMFWHDEKINDRKRLEIVVHQKQIRIVAWYETLELCLE